MNKLKNVVLVVMVCLLFITSANADILNLGGSFTNPIYVTIDGNQTSVGGGSIDISYLNNEQLRYVYCLDINTIIYAPGTYNNTIVSTDGTIYGKKLASAGQISWLLNNYGNQQNDYALQVAIWHLINPSVTIDPVKSNPNDVLLYNQYITSIGNNISDSSDFLWLSPMITGSNTKYQGLVVSKTPIPPSLFLLFSGLLGVFALRRK